MSSVSFWTVLDFRLERSYLMAKPSTYHEVQLVYNNMGFSKTPLFHLVSLSAPVLQHTNIWLQTNSAAFLLSLSALSTPDGTHHHPSVIHPKGWTLDLRSSEEHF